MSHAGSPSTGRIYGVAHVLREWEMARSSFYYQRRFAGLPFRLLQRRGPKTAWTDAALTDKIRAVLAASPFYGEGHRKVWARLRFEVLRLMGEAQLLAPSRTVPKAENPQQARSLRSGPT